MSKKLGIIACLCSLQLHAETDSFNMSLAGDFSKDYCTITTTSNSVDVSFDVSEREMAYAEGGYEGEMAYHFLNAMVITVNCSPGAYNLAVSNTEVRSRVYIGGDGSVMAQNIHVFANGASDFEPEVDSGSPASVSNVNPLGDGKLAPLCALVFYCWLKIAKRQDITKHAQHLPLSNSGMWTVKAIPQL